MPLIVIIVIILFSVANVYLYRRVKSVLPDRPAVRWATAIILLFLLSSYLIAQLGKHVLPPGVVTSFRWVGSWWIGFLFYVVLILFLFDLVRVLGRLFHFLPPAFWRPPKPARRGALLVIGIVVLAIMLAGHFNARNPRLTTVELRLGPSCGPVKRLNVVFLSDLHLGIMVKGSFLKRVVERVNHLNPDLVLLGGDIVDMDVRAIKGMGYGEILSRFRAPLGVYAVTGNHEYIVGAKKSIECLSRFGIIFLRNRAVKISDSFYLAGRDNIMHRRAAPDGKTLPDVLQGIDPRCPVILMDHSPSRLEEAIEERVDLVLSGHTHHGQLFPINLITDAIYLVSWGYYREGKTQVYVSSGAGTWGPPVRIGNRPEIVNLKITFGEQSTDPMDYAD